MHGILCQPCEFKAEFIMRQVLSNLSLVVLFVTSVLHPLDWYSFLQIEVLNLDL
jgi:hypothetical protein